MLAMLVVRAPARESTVMSHYRIISVDPPGNAVDLAEEDSAMAFKIAQELEASVLDILRDDKYAFSLCRLHGEDGFWAIFQRAQQTITRCRSLSRRRDE